MVHNIPHTEQGKANIRKGMIASDKKIGRPKGYHHSKETIRKIKESNLNSKAQDINADRMRGGNDLVNHHYIYDHNDHSKYTIVLTRSDHMRLHKYMRNLGFKIPHINEDVNDCNLTDWV